MTGIKVIKVGNRASIWLNEKESFLVSDITDEDMLWLLEASEDEVKERFITSLKSNKIAKELKKEIEQVPGLVVKDSLVTIPEISQVGLPPYLKGCIEEAHKSGDEKKLMAYRNFWKLICLNPNAEARTNLLFFLEENKFKILESGLFVAYRNVIKKNPIPPTVFDYFKSLHKNIKKVQKKSPKKYQVYQQGGEFRVIENNPKSEKKKRIVETFNHLGSLHEVVQKEGPVSYTDNHTKTMNIVLGQEVRISREECDEDSNQSCSRGLHLAKKDWRDLGSFGDTSLMCLCNPRDVVAVPRDINYGKLRTCAYLPLQEVLKDSEGKIVEDISDGDEVMFLDINYDGVVNNDKSDVFQDIRLIEKEDPLYFGKVKKTLEEIKLELDKLHGKV